MVSTLRQLSDELESLVARTTPAVVGVQHRGGQGTGLVLAPDGWVLTNCHVVRAAPGAGAAGKSRAEIRIGFADGSDLRGEVVGEDERTDLAVVRVGAAGLPHLALAERTRVRVGQLVVAIGNPLHFDRSVSLGVVSALDRSLPAPGGHLLEGLVQTDAAINPGNSGGPLLDADGAVVGINTAIIPYAQGIGFAVPAHTAHWVAAVLLQKGEVRRPVLGVAASGVDVGSERARTLGQLRAVRVHDVVGDSPAARAGLRRGDLVVAANDAPVASIDDLQRVMVLSGADELRLDVLRNGGRLELRVQPAPVPTRA
jgi:S1-C subfamily serine protease